MNGPELVKKVKLPVLVIVLLGLTLTFGVLTGAFMYATGDAIIEEGFTLRMVSHTEYRFGEAGQIVARLVDYQGNAIAVDNCTATILYPDKSIFVDEALMSDTGNITGDHYYAFTTPAAGPEGVYEYQATCVWNGGARSQSVTNSFHLSGAFNQVLGNLTEIDTTLIAVQGNLTQLSVDLFAINDSLSADIASLSNQLNENMSTVFANFDDIQANFTSTFTKLDALNSTLATEFAIIQSNFSSVFTDIAELSTQLNANVSQILTAIDNIVVDVNLTTVYENQALILGNLTEIDTTLSTVVSNQAAINSTLQDMSAALDEINATTQSTYQYLSVTLAGNIQDIFTELGIINATVNRIEANTLEINTTTAAILQNQEDEVYMSTFSG